MGTWNRSFRSKFKSKSPGTKFSKFVTKKPTSTSKKIKEDTEDILDEDNLTSITDKTQQNAIATLFEKYNLINTMDEQMGYFLYTDTKPRDGWLINFQTTLINDSEWLTGRSALNLYFIEASGVYFKAQLVYSPYFYLYSKNPFETLDFLKKRFGNLIEKTEKEEKEDLALKNHLGTDRRTFLKVYFRNTEDMATVRKQILLVITSSKGDNWFCQDGFSSILQIREHDIPYQIRVSIDLNIRAGMWYRVSVIPQSGSLFDKTTLQPLENQPIRPDPTILAFDIETTKQPLKFPSPASDIIMMISYMIDGDGFLIVNRDVVKENISDFEYTPKPEFKGLFHVFNVSTEYDLLVQFFAHIQAVRPAILASFNGDSFDWPFIEHRALANNLNLASLLGIYKHRSTSSVPTTLIEITALENNEKEAEHTRDKEKGSLPFYSSSWGIHMDIYKWVKRDSYLPAGSQGLKAVTSIKLGYTPLEIDPEDMVSLAHNDPQKLAAYSVSDALCTFHLYLKYVHPFIFSLSSIIPLPPDDVLRKGTGTLCETLLMAEAYQAMIIMPDKIASNDYEHVMTPDGKHLLDNETYVGGRVEALESGLFRSDLPIQFSLDSSLLEQLECDFKDIILFSLDAEHHITSEEIEGLDIAIEPSLRALAQLRKNPIIMMTPLIYHLDVAAMYPNIILTNRLSPPSIVNEETCAHCVHNRPGKSCQRLMEWSWRGEHFVAQRNELRMIQNQLYGEVHHGVKWSQLSTAAQNAIYRQRVSTYCRKIYHKIHSVSIEKRNSIVCQKENPFYVDTVKKFRDRRYEYKSLHKKAKKAVEEPGLSLSAQEEAKKLVVLYDSLQLAHKVILNSFYGYVMKKGSRWYSMEMAGVVCETGASIIRVAREWMEKLGRPLELDTDGIWLTLPSIFPDKININLLTGSTITISFPCAMLNRVIHRLFTNHQYHHMISPIRDAPPQRTFKIVSENSIFFEIDGPYRAMILPASTEEDRLLKKRYAVFSNDGSLSELKGFEVKRRGELRLTKLFQSELFFAYLKGESLAQAYAHVATIASHWLNLLDSKGVLVSEAELFELVTESRTMSKPLNDYSGISKSSAITTAKRLAEFLGSNILSGEGLSSLTCAYIIAAGSKTYSIAERAIPVAIWSAEPDVRDFYLSAWIKSIGGKVEDSFSLHSLLDWGYYKERFISLVLKLIVIPAAIQGITNPFGKRIALPSWLYTSQSQEKKTQLTLMNTLKIDDIQQAQKVDSLFPQVDDKCETPRLPKDHKLLYTSYKEWLGRMCLFWSSLNASKKRRGKRWMTSPSPSYQGLSSVLGISILQEDKRIRLWVLPFYTNNSRENDKLKGVFSQLRKLDIELVEAFASCIEIDPDYESSFYEYCEKHQITVISNSDQFSNINRLADGLEPEGKLIWVYKNKKEQILMHRSILNVYDYNDSMLKAMIKIGAITKGLSTAKVQIKDEYSHLYLSTKGELPFVFVYCFDSKNVSFLLIHVSLGLTSSFSKTVIITTGTEPLSRTSVDKLVTSMGLICNITDLIVDSVSTFKQFVSTFLNHLKTLPGATSALLIITTNSERFSKSSQYLERPILWRPYDSSSVISSVTQALSPAQFYLKESIRVLLELPNWLKKQVSQSRLFNVPLCRPLLGLSQLDDNSEYDVLFLRTLASLGRLYPREKGDLLSQNFGEYLALNNSLLELKNASLCGPRKELLGVSLHSTHSALGFSSENYFLNQPGYYEHVSFQLEFSSIYTNVLLEHSHLIPIEKPMEDKEGVSTDVDTTSFSNLLLKRMNRVTKNTISYETSLYPEAIFSSHGRASIAPLISLVSYLTKKKTMTEHDAFTEDVKSGANFVKWLTNEDGLASYLLGVIYQLKHRLLLMLVAQLNKVGLTVIMIDKGEILEPLPILVATNKYDHESAIYHLRWALGEITKLPGLCWLDVNIVCGWKRLLWLDDLNYCGLNFDFSCKNPLEYDGIPISQVNPNYTYEETTDVSWSWQLAANALPQDGSFFALKAMRIIFDAFGTIFPSTKEDIELTEETITMLFSLVKEFNSYYNNKENKDSAISFAYLISMLLMVDSRFSEVQRNSLTRSLLALSADNDELDSGLYNQKIESIITMTPPISSLKNTHASLYIGCKVCMKGFLYSHSENQSCKNCGNRMEDSYIRRTLFKRKELLLWRLCHSIDLATYECHACGYISDRYVSRWCPKCTTTYSQANLGQAFDELENLKKLMIQ